MNSDLLLLEQSRNDYGRLLRRELDEIGVDPRESLVLRLAYLNRRVSIAAVRERTGMAASTVTSVVSRLEGDGLVVRFRTWPDHRVVWIEATQMGARVARMIGSAIDDLRAHVVALPNTDIDILASLALALNDLAHPRGISPLN